MLKFLRTTLAATVFSIPLCVAGGVTLTGVTLATATEAHSEDRREHHKRHKRHGKSYRFHVRGTVRNDSHWVLRRAENGLYRYWREALIDSSNPLTGPTRYRYSTNRGPSYVYDGTDPAQNGVLKLGATRMNLKPAARIIHVDKKAVELAEERAQGRWERFEAEDVEIRFHTPRQAYDSRFPNVIYLDSR